MNEQIPKNSINQQDQKIVKFKYINYRGDCSWREVLPLDIRFGTSNWHSEPQWLLRGFDLNKDAEREFALKDILVWN